jgi:hypothetical protein
VRNIRIDTSLISRFSQAAGTGDDGAAGGTPLGRLLYLAST